MIFVPLKALPEKISVPEGEQGCRKEAGISGSLSAGNISRLGTPWNLAGPGPGLPVSNHRSGAPSFPGAEPDLSESLDSLVWSLDGNINQIFHMYHQSCVLSSSTPVMVVDMEIIPYITSSYNALTFKSLTLWLRRERLTTKMCFCCFVSKGETNKRPVILDFQHVRYIMWVSGKGREFRVTSRNDCLLRQIFLDKPTTFPQPPPGGDTA